MPAGYEILKRGEIYLRPVELLQTCLVYAFNIIGVPQTGSYTGHESDTLGRHLVVRAGGQLALEKIGLQLHEITVSRRTSSAEQCFDIDGIGLFDRREHVVDLQGDGIEGSAYNVLALGSARQTDHKPAGIGIPTKEYQGQRTLGTK